MDTASPTVLLIEDEPLIRMCTSAMLEDSGYTVLEAGNADEAQAVLMDHPEVSIVVTDVQMPGATDGLALASILKRDYSHIRVLVTSGRAGLQEAREHGAADYLSKPYTADAIQRALDGLATTKPH
jgi:CheY-like chemotaxis protein